MNQVATIQPSRMPIPASVAKEFELQPADWRVLVEQIFPAAKSVESVMMALAYCRNRKLDIFKKPVHIVPMWSAAAGRMVETVWPGIAEIRTTASRTGEYAGIDAVEFGPVIERTFTGYVGRNNEQVAKKVRFPEWASVVVYRMVSGVRCPYHAKVFWEETYATIGKTDVPNEMWAKRTRGQLDKCVEAAALRKAFPEEIGNMYAAEEMEGRTIDHASIGSVTPPSPPAAPPAPAEIEGPKGEKPTTPPPAPDENGIRQPPDMPAELDRTKKTHTKTRAKKSETIDPQTGEIIETINAPPSFPGTDDPEKFLKWIEAMCTAVNESDPPDALQDMWNDKIAPHLDGLFPPDAEEAHAIYDRHERRLAPA